MRSIRAVRRSEIRVLIEGSVTGARFMVGASASECEVMRPRKVCNLDARD